jgi:hypoxanthine-DNA glycosylase
MVETHVFGNFVPLNAEYLILGSFTGRQAVKDTAATDDAYDWFYGTKRNQFWPILEDVYGIELRDKHSKQELFTKLGIAIADIIYQCERRDDSNLDNNLINMVYNIESITEILENNQIKKILFTSKFVEDRFMKVFKEVVNRHPSIQYVTLPSPSPRYARMSKEQKIQRYRELLPQKK